MFRLGPCGAVAIEHVPMEHGHVKENATHPDRSMAVFRVQSICRRQMGVFFDIVPLMVNFPHGCRGHHVQRRVAMAHRGAVEHVTTLHHSMVVWIALVIPLMCGHAQIGRAQLMVSSAAGPAGLLVAKLVVQELKRDSVSATVRSHSTEAMTVLDVGMSLKPAFQCHVQCMVDTAPGCNGLPAA